MSSDPISILKDAFSAAIAAAYPGLAPSDADPLLSPSKQAQFGDYQSNAAMAIAKKVNAKPRDVASKIIASLDVSAIAEPITDASIAGPGFINIRLKGSALDSLLAAFSAGDLGIQPAQNPETIVVDLFGVNLAKQMHVGHLRSPFIGDAIARSLERLGHTVLRQNHVGDWGLPIAMVTDRLIRLSKAGKIDLAKITLEDLDKNYKAAQAECQRDAAGLEAAKRFGMGPKALAELEEQVAGATDAFTRARQTLLKLQAKDPETYAVWKRIADVTMGVCLSVAKRLHVNVTDAHSAGESSYAEELGALVADLETRGIAEPDQGALIIRLDDPPAPWTASYGLIKEPCLIRKTDGGYLYATTDIAAVRRRVQKLGATRAVYAIDARQSLHMRQVFASSWKAGYTIHPKTKQPATLEHAAFGSVLGEDGRPFKTRSGENVSLQSLIDEAVERAYVAIKSRAGEGDGTMPEHELRATAEAIGVAAMKYADLSSDRIKDYTFSLDRMLAFEGNTGPYLLYAVVRIKSIFRKAAERGLLSGGLWGGPAVPAGSSPSSPSTSTRGTGVSPVSITSTFNIQEPAEKTLALTLLRYPAAVRGVASALEPHRLCTYLYELAGAFSSFFENCPVLTAPDEPTRAARLALCDLTCRTLVDGLSVLGIPTVDKM